MIQPIILAAGKGTRMRSELPKALHEIDGKPMLTHLLETLKDEPGYLPPIVVVGYMEEMIRIRYRTQVTYARQEDIRGTALAVKAALHAIPDDAKTALVLYGDQPFLRKETLATLRQAPYTRATLVLGEVEVPQFEGEFKPFEAFGRLLRDSENRLQRVVEFKNASPKERDIKSLNAGLFAIEMQWLRSGLNLISPDPVSGEYYLTSLLEIAYQEKKQIECLKMKPKEALGINSQEDATAALNYL
ncbi:MAG: NTP transferase domain-containing protein [bacterium]|nr:NTP transferase domain-containing protein [bacterium]